VFYSFPPTREWLLLTEKIPAVKKYTPRNNLLAGVRPRERTNLPPTLALPPTINWYILSLLRRELRPRNSSPRLKRPSRGSADPSPTPLLPEAIARCGRIFFPPEDVKFSPQRGWEGCALRPCSSRVFVAELVREQQKPSQLPGKNKMDPVFFSPPPPVQKEELASDSARNAFFCDQSLSKLSWLASTSGNVHREFGPNVNEWCLNSARKSS